VQWLQVPNQSSVDNLNNVRHEASRHFRNKMREYLKAKINDFETNSKNRSITVSQTCIKASVTLRRVASLEIIQCRMRRVIWLQTPRVF
jgi:hypothetical protein